MRRALILFLLLVGMGLIRPLGHEVPSSESLLAFGFLILAAYTVGEIASGVGLPKLVGYIIAGILFGPAALQTVSEDVVLRLGSVNQLAVALIAFMAGAELKWQDVRERGIGYTRVILTEMPLVFGVLVAVLFAVRGYIPALQGEPPLRALVFALLLAAILAAHSPAATLGLLTETRARGPVSQTTLGVVLVSDVFLILLFTLAATVSRAIVPPPGLVQPPGALLVIWEISGALVVGSVMGAIIALYLRFIHRDLLLFGIIVALLGAELARLAHVEVLLTLLTAGFVMENFTPDGAGEALRHAVERAAAPVFVVFFALAGASVQVAEVVALGWLVIPLALVRGVTIWGGTAIGARWAGLAPVERRYLWMGLISHAGVAIGLASLAASVYPELGATVAAVALAIIPLNQLIGPILFKRALAAAGEIPAVVESAEHESVNMRA